METDWNHIWMLDALFGSLVHDIDEVATRTWKGGFTMDFLTCGQSVCELFFDDSPKLLVNCVSLDTKTHYALLGICETYNIEYVEVMPDLDRKEEDNGTEAITRTT